MKPVLKTRPLKTVRDYMRLPVEHGVELIEGELVMSPSPGVRHQRLVGNLYLLLRRWLGRKGRGEVILSPMDVILSVHTVVQPDLLVVLRRRSSIVRDRIRGAPDIAIEVLSPSSLERDRLIKRHVYASHGIREYWIVDPQTRTIEVYSRFGRRFRLHGAFEGDDRISTPVLPDLRLDPKSIWGSGRR
jgi:Uma2 family endonuclease